MTNPRRNLLVLGLGAVAMAAATTGCGSSSTKSGDGLSASKAPAPKFTPKPVSWHPCPKGAGLDGLECGTLAVPLDPQHPGKATVKLALDRHRATGKSKGALIYNPGGPGESAVASLPDIYKSLGPDLKADYDFTAFDPPGVGGSTDVQCLSSAELDKYFHEDLSRPGADGANQALTVFQQLGQGCARNSGALLPHVSTADAATDMEYVRQALGQGQLNYLGFSYGTELGQEYAHLFGPNIRSMVLDGDVNTNESQLDRGLGQAKAFQADFNAFTQACQSTPACPWKPGPTAGGSLATDYTQLVAKVRTQAVPAKGSTRTAGPQEFLTGTLATLYTVQEWPAAWQAIAQLEAGDATDVLKLADTYNKRLPNGQYENTIEAQAAVNCLDYPAPTPAQVQNAAPQFQAASPVFGLYTLYGYLSCSAWPVKTGATIHPASDPKAPPVLLVGSTGDPATPYSDSQALAGQLQRATLLTRQGNGHTGYMASSCIQGKVDRYVETLELPKAGTTCPSDKGAS